MIPKRLLAIVGVLALSILIVLGMVKLKPRASRADQPERPVTVDVYEISQGPWSPTLEATGKVSPAQEIDLSPRVSGNIIWISDNLMPGGRYRKGETIARIDPQDYEIAVAQEESKVQSNVLELDREKARQGVAQKEWELLGDPKTQVGKDLALRKPQLAAAALKAKAAESGLTRARLNLQRTWLRAPFDGAIVTESLDVGQLVGPNQRVAHLVGTNSFRVTVAVPVSALSWIHTEDSPTPSKAVVTQLHGQGQKLERTGRILKVLPNLNDQTRRAQILVAVDDPMGEDYPIPLLPGAFVTVHFEGVPAPNTLKVPRDALREGNITWLISAESQLKPTHLAPLWQTEDAVFVTDGVAPGDRVLITPLSLPIEGMTVITRNVTKEQSAPVEAALRPSTAKPDGSAP